MTKPKFPRRRAATEFRVSPPLIQSIGARGFTGADLLDKDHIAGLVFWQSFRDVELWAGIGDDRGGLFHTGQVDARILAIDALDPEEYGEAKPHLRALADVVRAPEGADPSEVAGACSQLSNWFEGRGRLRSAVEFALAAYFVRPERASLAIRVARLSRMLTEYPRATSWFDYAVYLARKAGDWQAYAEAFAGLGNLHLQVGNLPRARYFHRRCLRVSSRKGLPEMVGAAYHNLFVLEMDAGNIELAEALAGKAVASYPEASPCVVRLVRDLSRRWTFLGHFRRALPLALETLHHFTVPADRALVWADVARAAGGAGEQLIFEDAWAETWVLVKRGVTDPYEADVLIDLAHGAASLGDKARAGCAAGRALEVATARKEGRTILEAEALLDSLHLKPPRPTTEFPTPTPDELPEFAGYLLRTLKEQRAAAA